MKQISKQTIKTTRRKAPKIWFSLCMGLVIFIVAVFLSVTLQKAEQSQIKSITKTAAENISNEIESEMRARILVISRISEHWALSGTPTKAEWDAEAKLYVWHYPGIQSLQWIDPSLVSRWIIPFPNNQHLFNKDWSSEQAMAQALEDAKSRRRAVMTDTVDLLRGGKGFHIYAPINNTGSGQFEGFIGGVFRTEKLFESILENMALKYNVSIMDGKGSLLYKRQEADPDSKVHLFGQQEDLTVQRSTWTLEVTPTRELIVETKTSLPWVVLAGGFLLALLFAGVIRLSQSTRIKALRIAQMNIDLRKQIHHRKQAEAAKLDSDERLNLALKSSGIGTWSWEMLDDEILWDDYMYPIFGMMPGSFHGGYEDFLERVHPEDREKMKREIQLAIEEGSDYDAEYRIIWGDDSIHFIGARGKVYKDSHGNPVRMTGVCWDFTERKKIDEMEKYAEVLKRSNEELERFAYVASHDLKSPLNNIVFLCRVLAVNFAKNVGEKGQQTLKRIEEASERMSGLISGLLDYSRAETEKQQFEEVELQDVIDEIVMDLETQIQSQDAEIKTVDLPLIMADRLQMRQLFQNLMTNALKFHTNKAKPQIIISGRTLEDDRVEICVRDNGIGIEKDALESIFRPFQRLHTRDEFEGNGIGLATCQRVVARHGGEIRAESEVGQGSAFFITLPLKGSPDLPKAVA